MRPRILSVVAIASAITGLGASIASLIDFAGAAPTFCAESGCASVRSSWWSHPLGVPMPVLGIVFFAAMLALSVIDRPRLRVVLAAAGGVWAITLIALQAFVIHAWCKLCLVADPAAILLAIAVIAGARTVRFTLPRLALAMPAVVAVVVGLGFVAHGPALPALPPGTPAAIANEQVAGKVTVVEFIDFECEFCRALAPKLEKAIAGARTPVHVVRKMVPLARHPHALTAALAWCCADAQGKGDQMAAALFAARPEELTVEGCESIAARVGCDLDRYRAERADPATRARIDRDVADAKAARVAGFPTVFIGGERIAGADHSADELARMIDRAAR